MAHKLIGSIVEYTRPVILKQGFRRLEGKGGLPEQIPDEVEMQSVPATVIGVEPSADRFPRVHLAFLHPEQLHHLGGSGWRDAFERVDSVRPEPHPDVQDNDHVPYYVSEDIYAARHEISNAHALGQTEPEPQPSVPAPPDPPTDVEPTDPSAVPAPSTPDAPPTPPAPATGRQRRKPGEPAQ